MFKEIELMTRLEAEEELAFLAKRMAELDIAYHQKDAPLVSDAEYDKLKRRNELLEEAFPDLIRPDSPSRKVGAAAAEGFGQITHSIPMLSLGISHPEKMTPEQLAEVERIVNEQIKADLPVVCREMSPDAARAEGAIGLFGNKYGDIVKVYSMGDFSKEICGGPHVQ